MRRSIRALAAMLLVSTVAASCGSSGSSKSSAVKSTDSGDFGTMKNVCHPSTQKNLPSSDRGVTSSMIRVTTISDAGSTLQPGLDQELWDAADVFSRWCNDHGGINGRQILVTKGDAQILSYDNAIRSACASSFALVGGGGVMDNLGQQRRIDCKLVAIPGFTASFDARTAPLSYPAVTSSATVVMGGDMAYLATKYGKNQHIASVYGDFPTTVFTSAQALATAKNANLVDGDPQPVEKYPPTGQPSWAKTATDIASSDATGMLFSGTPTDLGNLLAAISIQPHSNLKWVSSYPNMYDNILIQKGRLGLAKIPVYLQLFTFPFEDAGQGTKSAPIDQYLALFKKYLPAGKSRAMLGVQGFASWLLFARAASACGAQLTRKCLVAQIHKIHDFDAGGLIAPRVAPGDPTTPSTCFAVIKATPTGFVRVQDKGLEPSTNHWPFTCDQSKQFTLNQADPTMSTFFADSKWTDAQKSQIEASLP